MSMRFVFAVLPIAISACTANDTAVFRKFDVDGAKGGSVLIDAKQRAIISVERKLDDGERVRRFCAEPSPDALSAISSSFATSINVGLTGQGQGAAALGAALSEAASEIGKRTATIQILRDGFYRLCEAQLNGSTDDIYYNLHTNKLLNSMVSLLAIEELTPSAKEEFKVVTGGNSKVEVSTAVTAPAPAAQPEPAATGQPPAQPAGGGGDAATAGAPDDTAGGAEEADEEPAATPTTLSVESSGTADSGPSSVATKVSKGKDQAPSKHVAYSVALILSEYMRQSRFADCILAMDNIGIDLDLKKEEASKKEQSEPEPNKAQLAVIKGCTVVLSETRPEISINPLAILNEDTLVAPQPLNPQ